MPDIKNLLQKSSDRRKIRKEEDRIVSLFPYQIKNRNLFYHRDHPEKLNPDTRTYERYWGEQFKYYIEGRWINDEGTWVFMMPKLYFHINYAKIYNLDRVLISPDLRDIEWIVFSYILGVDGFSGFEGDTEFTCNHLVKKMEEGAKLSTKERLNVPSSCKKPNGDFKKYVDPWHYLTRHYLIEHPAKKPLGLPLYENPRKNGIVLSARGIGKSLDLFVGDFGHEFLTGGVKRFEDIGHINNSLNFVMGCGDSRQLDRSVANIKTFYDNMPGQFEYEDSTFMGPLYKRVQGSWETGKSIQHVVKRTDGTDKIRGSLVQMVALTPDRAKVGAGDRFRRIYIEEVGFAGNLFDIMRSNKDSMQVGGTKVGSMISLGCVCVGSKVWNNKGELRSIENLNQEEGILGYDYEKDKTVRQEISYVNPPQDKKCYRVKTNTGRFIDCSEDHPLYGRKRWPSEGLRLPKWFRTDEIELGDKIGVIDSVDFWGKNIIFDPRLIGWLIGDGTYGEGQNVRLVSADDEVWDHVQSRYQTVMTHAAPTKDGRITQKGRILGVRPEMKKLGIYGQTSIHKSVPKILHSCNKDVVCDFIGGYFDADGCVSIYNDIYPVIKASSISVHLLESIQLLLTKLGVHGRIVNEGRMDGTKGSNYDLYSIYIKDKYSIINFYNNIEFKIQRKQSKLKTAFEIAKNKKNGVKCKGIEGLRWEKVVSIESLGLQPVFNLNVSETNTYLVNGFHTHNTGGDLKAIQEPKAVFERINAYDIFGIPNYWKKIDKKVGLFIPANYALNDYKDENGNTDIEAAYYAIVDKRNSLREDVDAISYESEIMYNPLVPDEMLRPSDGSVLPKQAAATQLSNLETFDVFKIRAMIGDIVYNALEPRGVEFKKDFDGSKKPILKWGATSMEAKTDGAIIIYEDPPQHVPEGLYYVIYDPVSKSGDGTSYNSVLVYKNFYRGPEESLYDTIVAEWIGRKERLEDNYHMVIKIAKYFNAKIFPEVNVAGFVEWCGSNNYYSLLESDATYFLREELNPKYKSYYKVGFQMQAREKDWALRRLRDWLLEVKRHDPVTGVPTIKTIDWIFSPRILDEIIAYTDDKDYNFDHISSLLGLMILIGKLGKEPVDIIDEEEPLIKPEMQEYFETLKKHQMLLGANKRPSRSKFLSY